MLGIFLRILSILGIILLILLAVLIGGIVLVLFFPVSYRVYGGKDPSGLRITVKIKWLFGLLGIQGRYPEPGEIRIRVLCFTLFRKNLLPSGDEEPSEKKKAGIKKTGKKKTGKKKTGETKAAEKESEKKKSEAAPEQNAGSEAVSGKEEEKGQDGSRPKTENAVPPVPEEPGKEAENQESGPSSKFEKLKYTFRGIYDKIKKIWENISCYVRLLQREDVKELLSDSVSAAGKILKSIRPRHIRANIRFGTGSPDTTGYLYGAYCMAAPFLGAEVGVTPDFDEAVAEGEFDISGRITVWVLLVNGLKMYKLMRRLNAGKRKAAEGLRNGGENGR